MASVPFPSTATPTRQSSSQTLPSTSLGSLHTTTRRHSLYGTEDRVIIDPGSCIWKVGFSGESRPRDVFCIQGHNNKPSLWTLEPSTSSDAHKEDQRNLYNILQLELRKVFHNILLADPKSRKVIVVEHPLLPIYVKEMIGRILFENLLVPSISFAPSGLLSLLSVGRISGLVVDCGYLETTVMPFFSSRPLYSLVQCTPLAGLKLSSHIRALLLLFGRYYPPPATLSGPVNIQSTPKATNVPVEVMTDQVIQDILTRCCFIGEPLDDKPTKLFADRSSSPPPPSETVASSSEADYDHLAEETDPHVSGIHTLYKQHSSATDIRMRVAPPSSQQAGTGMGTLLIPGWIRERAAEILFDQGDVDERSIVEIILDSLRKLPIDLRTQMAHSILVTGGTSMLPGFTRRLRLQLKAALNPLDNDFSTTITSPSKKRKRPLYDPYNSIRFLQDSIAIINDTDLNLPMAGTTEGLRNAGKAPAFSASLLPWIGGSLAGSLKTGGQEFVRERWDEAASASEQDDPDPYATHLGGSASRSHAILPDWTRTPLVSGAPVANILRLQATVAAPS